MRFSVHSVQTGHGLWETPFLKLGWGSWRLLFLLCYTTLYCNICFFAWCKQLKEVNGLLRVTSPAPGTVTGTELEINECLLWSECDLGWATG